MQHLPDEQFDILNYAVLNKLSQNADYDFFEVIHNQTKIHYTAQVSKQKINEFPRNKLILLTNHLKVISKINHPLILNFVGYSPIDFNGNPNPVIITEYIKRNSLAHLNKKSKYDIESKSTDCPKFRIIYKIALAMAYLHSNDIIHGNLCSENIFLSDDFEQLKLTGFDYSFILDKPSVSFNRFYKLNGNPEYFAPEIFESKTYSKASDVYSFSFIIEETLSPITFLKSKRRYIKNNIIFKFVHPAFFRTLIEKIVNLPPNERPTFDQIVDYLKPEFPNINTKMLVNNMTTTLQDSIPFSQFNKIIKSMKESEIDYIQPIEQLPNWNSLNFKNFEILTKIEETDDYTLFEVFNKENGIKYLAKKYTKQNFNFTKCEMEDLIQEIDIISRLNHPSINKFYGYCQDDSHPILITEHLSYRSLRFILDNKDYIQYLDDTQKLIIIYGIASAMSYLHSNNIIHRDLTPKNIFVDDILLPKITGFHFSQKLPLKNRYLNGTPAYFAPEVFLKQEYSKSSDVYAFSLIVYEIMTNKKPLQAFENPQFNSFVQMNFRPFRDYQIPTCYWNLMEKCWSRDPNHRPSFDEIQNILKTNTDFITQSVNAKDFQTYVNFIDNCKITFDTSERKNQIDIPSEIGDDVNQFFLGDIYNSKRNLIFNLNIFGPRIFEKGRFINNTNYSILCEVMHKETKEKYAAKITKSDGKSNFNSQELDILAQLNHPSIIKFIGFSLIDFDSNPYPVIMTEIASVLTLQSIFDLLCKEEKVPCWDDTRKLIIIYGIASGMEYLHSNNIIHSDLNPKNILFDKYFFPKIIDFGLAKYSTSYTIFNPKGIITAAYMAPETIKHCKLFKSSDVFSFSIILYGIITSMCPYPGYKNDNSIKIAVSKGKRPIIPKAVPKCFSDLIKQCWDSDPNKRPTFQEIVNLLKTDERFISKDVNVDMYKKFIQYVNENQSSFGYQERIKKKIEILDSFPDKHGFLFEYDNEKSLKYLILYEYYDVSNFEKLSKIGEGGFYNVYKVRNKVTQKIYAAKISKYDLDYFKYEQIIDLEREVSIFSKINYISILKHHGFSPKNFKGKLKPTIIIDLATNESLDSIIELERKGNSHPKWNDTKKLINIYGIASAMKYLHRYNIIHRDLKPNNVLLDENLYPKLADFGISKYSQYAQLINSGFKGTFAYAAPEILIKNEYTQACDVYSFALIVYELITGDILYPQFQHHAFPYQLIKFVRNGGRPEFDHEIPLCYKNLIKECWSQDPLKRPGFGKIISMLESDPDFITEKVDKKEFHDYIKLIKYQVRSEPLQINNENDKLIREEIDNKSLLNDNFVSLSKFKPDEMIQKDLFSKVYKIISKENGDVYLCKISRYKISDKDTNLTQEIDLISHLDHPSLLKFIGYSPTNFKNEQKLAIISEFVENGSLRQILAKERKGTKPQNWTNTKKLIVLFGIAAGMSYLHSKNITFRDLRPENIFLDRNYYPKIGDTEIFNQYCLSVSKSFQSTSGIDNSLVYSAPETLQSNEYTQKSNVYSYSMIAYEIVSCIIPFDNLKNKNDFINTVVTNYDLPKFSETIPKCYQELIETCWSHNSEERPTFDEIMQALKTNSDFIDDSICQEEFFSYVELIEGYSKK